MTNSAFSVTGTTSGGGSGVNISNTIAQTAHGFSVGQVLYLNGTVYALAKADSVVTAEVVGVVSSVVDANDFVLTTDGYVTGLSGLTAGSVYFLSDATAGLATVTAPVTVGNVIKAVWIAATTTSSYVYQQSGKVIPVATSNAGRLLSIQYLTSGTAATYTKNVNATSILVECLGGGGGGGGSAAATSNGAAAGGGASGGYCRKYITSASATYTYTVGAAGAAGSTGFNNGGTGGTTTFSGGTMSAGGGGGGGAGGTGSTAVVTFSGAPGALGTVSGGDINVPGQSGGSGFNYLTVAISGEGGSNLYGQGAGISVAANAQNTAGASGNNYGSGGAGGCTNNTVSTAAGGAGTVGIIIVYEYS